MAEKQTLKPSRLTCIECGQRARGEASGWRAYLKVNAEIAVYCAVCSEREFGEDEAK